MQIVHLFAGKVWGGAEQYVLDLGLAQRERGHHVSFVCRAGGAVPGRLDGNAAYTAIEYGKRGVQALAAAVAGTDVVHVHEGKQLPMVWAACAGMSRPPRVVLTRHIARASRVWPWQRRHYRRLHAMVFVSRLGYRLWHGVNRWMPPSQCICIHNSVKDTGHVDSEAATAQLRQRLGIGPGTPLLLFAGRVRRSKGCGDIIEALGALRHLDWHMVFAGTAKPADYADRLMRRAARLGIAHRVHLLGFRTDVPALIAAADLCLAPSRVREAGSLAVLEFMQAGKCLIASDNGSQGEYVLSDDMGLLVAPGNAAQLGGAIAAMLSHPAQRIKKGAAARDYFDSHLAYGTFVDKILAAYGR